MFNGIITLYYIFLFGSCFTKLAALSFAAIIHKIIAYRYTLTEILSLTYIYDWREWRDYPAGCFRVLVFEITPYIKDRANITVTAQFDLNTIQSKSQYRFAKQACVFSAAIVDNFTTK